MDILKPALLIIFVALSGSAHATIRNINAKVVSTQGHVYPACRTLEFKEIGTGTMYYLRVPYVQDDNSILSVAMSAQISNLTVSVVYDDAATTGCGPEPAIQYISMTSPN